MVRSPLERMIDAACKCVKCGRAGEPGSCGCWIKLQCPKCGTSRLTDRDATDPPAAVRLQVQCPYCNPGDFDEPIYFDALGRQMRPKDSTHDRP